MAEGQTAAEAGKKPKTVVTPVTMEDGRVVEFAGNRKMDKDYEIDDAKIQLGAAGEILLAPGAVCVRIDFRNGKTVRYTPPASVIAKTIGHGSVQKLGDEAASEKEVDDAFMAIEDLAKRLEAGEWNVAREAGGGFSGASLVVRAIVEAQAEKGKTISVEEVKTFLQKKLDDSKAKGDNPPLTRPALYASFRNPQSRTGQIIKRLEEEKASKGNAVDADAALEEMGGAAA